MSPESQKGPAPAQPAAAGDSGNRAASCKGLTDTEVDPDANSSRSPNKAKAHLPAQPAAADDSGDRVASYRGLIGTEVEPEVHILHSGQHDLATSWAMPTETCMWMSHAPRWACIVTSTTQPSCTAH